MNKQLRLIEPDSSVFGQSVFEIESFKSKTDLNTLIKKLEDQNTLYAYCKLSDKELSKIHLLEQAGFNFIESQFKVQINIERAYNPMMYYPYKIGLLSNKAELKVLYAIIEENLIENRVSSDPGLKSGLGLKRYKAYLEKSFSNPNEDIYKIFNSRNNEIIGFQTNTKSSNHTAQLYLSGLKKSIQSFMEGINYLMHFEALRNEGYELVTTSINGNNFKEMNYEISGFEYKIIEHHIVLRKIFGGQLK